MTNKEAMEIVLALANEHRELSIEGLEAKEFEALAQMEDYYNDVMEDEDDLIITQGDKKLKDMLED